MPTMRTRPKTFGFSVVTTVSGLLASIFDAFVAVVIDSADLIVGGADSLIVTWPIISAGSNKLDSVVMLS